MSYKSWALSYPLIAWCSWLIPPFSRLAAHNYCRVHCRGAWLAGMVWVVAPAVIAALAVAGLTEEWPKLVDKSAFRLFLASLGEAVHLVAPGHETNSDEMVQIVRQRRRVALQEAAKIGHGHLFGEALAKQPEHDLQDLVLPVELVER